MTMLTQILIHTPKWVFALFAVLFFGGQVLTPCLGFHCPPPSDGPIPIIGTATGFRVTVGVLAAAWTPRGAIQ